MTLSHILHIALLTTITLQVTHGCRLDGMCFAVDQSNGTKGSTYESMKTMISNMAKGTTERMSGVMFSAYGYSESATVMSEPTTDLEKFLTSVRGAEATGGSMNMYAGMKACLDKLMYIRGKRVLVVVTASKDVGLPRAVDLVMRLKADGVSVVALGTGQAHAKELEKLSTCGACFMKTTKKSLVDKAGVMVDKACMATQVEGDVCQSAYEACDFKFKGMKEVPTYSVRSGGSDTVFTEAIEKRTGDERIGVLNTNGLVPEFIRADGTSFGVDEIGSPRLSASSFKPIFIVRSYRSALGHEAFAGSQLSLVRDSCVRVYFTMYQTLSTGWPPVVVNNVNVGRKDNKCVVFKTM